MKILEITPQRLKKINDKELLSLHRRMHQLFANLLKRFEEKGWRIKP